MMNYIQEMKDDLIDFTRKIVKIPSFTGEEGAVAKEIFTKLSAADLDDVWIDGIGNVIAVIHGGGNGPHILLNGHMDVVPPGKKEDWRYDPFSATIDKDGKIYGRGTADMKGGLAALIYTMLVMNNLKNEGLDFPGDIIFSSVVHEEAAEMFGMDYLINRSLHDKGIRPDVCYLAEPTNGRINLGHRGKVEIVIETTGKSVHSSRPWQGINALEKMLPILDAIFNRVAPDLPDHPDLGKCSITVTNLICKPGTMSIVPDSCEISVDRRYLPGETLDSIVADFEALLNEFRKRDPAFMGTARIRTILERSYTGYEKEVLKHHPVWIMEKTNPYVKKTYDALNAIGQGTNYGYFTGGVDGALTAGLLGIPTIGYSNANESLAHTSEESTTIYNLIKDTMGYVTIISELFGIRPAEQQ